MIRNEEVYKLLSRPKKIKKKIMRVNSEINALTLDFALPKGLSYDKDPVQVSSDDPMAKYMAKKDRLERRRNRLIDEYYDAQDNISRRLDKVEETGALIITLRFIEDIPFPHVAKSINMSERQMYRHYKEALIKLAENL